MNSLSHSRSLSLSLSSSLFLSLFLSRSLDVSCFLALFHVTDDVFVLLSRTFSLDILRVFLSLLFAIYEMKYRHT